MLTTRDGRSLRAAHIVSFLVLLALVALAGASFGQDLVREADVGSTLELRDLARTAEGISGIVVSRVPRELREVRILVQLVYHWPDEMHPGPDSPSAAAVVTVEGPIPPGGSAPFEARLAVRPDVAAGPATGGSDFEVRAAILGWSEVGATPGSDSPEAGPS